MLVKTVLSVSDMGYKASIIFKDCCVPDIQKMNSDKIVVTVQTGCAWRLKTAQSIHLREKNIAGPTERSKTRMRF